MRVRALLTGLQATALALVLAGPAAAGDNGEGLVGETDDRIVTAFGLGAVVFFTLVAVLGTVLQSRLERRKQERKAAEALARRLGW